MSMVSRRIVKGSARVVDAVPRLAFLTVTIALCAPGLAAAKATPADSLRAVATASKTEVSVGESFTVEVRAEGPAGTTFEFSPEAVHETFELRTPPPDPRVAEQAPAGMHRYHAAVFAIGDAEVPAIPVRYRLADGTTGEIATAPIPLRVVSLLPKEKSEQKLADVRGPVGVPLARVFWFALAVAVLLLGALAWWLKTRRRRVEPVAVAAAPKISPNEEALLALKALAQSGRLARGEFRPFYIDLTAIAKRYLERRLEAPIVEMTTAEMLAHLKSDRFASDLTPTLRDLSGAADQIKFARGSGMVEEAERHLAATRALIDTLETRVAAAASQVGTGAAPAAGGRAA